jgi:hypothetical protein
MGFVDLYLDVGADPMQYYFLEPSGFDDKRFTLEEAHNLSSRLLSHGLQDIVFGPAISAEGVVRGLDTEARDQTFPLGVYCLVKQGFVPRGDRVIPLADAIRQVEDFQSSR